MQKLTRWTPIPESELTIGVSIVRVIFLAGPCVIFMGFYFSGRIAMLSLITWILYPLWPVMRTAKPALPSVGTLFGPFIDPPIEYWLTPPNNIHNASPCYKSLRSSPTVVVFNRAPNKGRWHAYPSISARVSTMNPPPKPKLQTDRSGQFPGITFDE